MLALRLEMFANCVRDTAYLRNSGTDLRVLLFNIANGRVSFAYHGAHLWNSHESEVKQAPSEHINTYFVVIALHCFSVILALQLGYLL